MKNEEPLEEKANPAAGDAGETEVGLAELKQAMVYKDRELDLAAGKISGLEEALADRDREISSLKEAAVRSGEEQKHLQDKLLQAVSGYRSLVTRDNPDVPADLIAGDSVETVDASLARARELVSRVKQGLETENIKIRVPAGAPVRMPPDTGGLSAREKIQYAIGGNK